MKTWLLLAACLRRTARAASRAPAWLAALLLLGWGGSAAAQSATPAPLLPPYLLPKSPTAGTLQRFDSQQLVNPFTGAAQLAIPLADVQSGPLHVPVSLAYSYMGLQVYQPRELVGLGWSLQADASISLHVNGRLDWTMTDINSRYTPDTVNTHTQYWLNRAGRQLADTGPDVYAFSLPGGVSGHFLLHDTTAVLLPAQPVKVRMMAALNNGFQVMTEDGQRYQFQAVETTHSGTEFGLGNYVSSWHLTRIISASNADTITFHYSASHFPVGEPIFRHIAVTTGSYALGVDGYSPNAEYECSMNTAYHWSNAIIGNGQTAPQFLDSITTRGMRVIFGRENAKQTLQQVQVVSTLGRRREIRRFTLFHSYFSQLGTNNAADQRLRLDSVQESAQALRLPPYRLTYLTEVDLPPRSSAAIDFWGYYNGATSNGDATITGGPALLADPKLGSLMPNRRPNFSYAVAGSLAQVRYPTGGYSRWEYEPNRMGVGPPVAPVAVRDTTRLDMQGSYNSDSTHYALAGNAKVTYSRVLTFQLPEDGTVVLDLARTLLVSNPQFKNRSQDFNLWQHTTPGDSTLITVIPANSPVQPYSIKDYQSAARFRFALTAGTYSVQLYCESNESLLASVAVPYTVAPDTGPFLGEVAGGVRVWRTQTATAGAPPLYRTYEYLVPDSVRAYCSGVPLVSSIGFAYKKTLSAHNDCANCLIAHTSSDNAQLGDELSRYPFYYSCVTVRDSASHGATTSYYTPLPSQFNEVVLTRQQVFRQHPQQPRALQLIQEEEHRYATDSLSFYPYVRVFQERFNKTYNENTIGGQVLCAPELVEDRWAVEQFATMIVAAALPVFTRQTRYGEHADTAVTLTRTSYTRQRVVRSATRTSTGWRIQRYKRLSDYAATDTVTALRVNNFNPLIETQTWQRPLTGPDSALVAGQLTFYDPRWRSPARTYRLRLAQPLPGLNRETKQGGRYAHMLSDTRYELLASVRYAATCDDLLEQRPAHGVPTSYLTGYAHTLLLAEAKNAPYAQVAYTSFEPEATGRWRYDSLGTHRQPGGRTGRWAYQWDGTNAGKIDRYGLPAGDYELTFWAKGGLPTLTVLGGTVVTANQLLTTGPDGWQQYRNRLHLPAAGYVSLNGPTGLLDELRLCPVGAQLTSYTHEPLVGETSVTGPDGRTTTYEYDALGRLVRTRDERGRILGQQHYHYAGH